MSKSLKAAFKNEPRKFSGQNNWLKLDVGSHILRLCPRWNNETVKIEGEEISVPFRSAEQHPMLIHDGKKVMPQCLGFVFNDEDLTKKAFLAGKITKDDYDKWDSTECPLCAIADALIMKRDKKDKANDTDYQRFMSSKKYYFNVVKRTENKVYMFSRSQKFFDEVQNALEVYPNLFDDKKGNDFSITATGEGLSRDYSSPMFFPKPTPLALAKGETLHDLDTALISGIRTFDEMVEIARTNYQPIVKRSGVDLNKFMHATAKKSKKK